MDDFDPKILKERVRREADRKIFEKVFDAQTLTTIHSLAVKGHFDVLEHIVSTGKEAHVFAATDSSGNTRAVKIFKKETTDFKTMQTYIEHDVRFRELRKDRRNLVYAWTKKEYKNLLMASRAKLNTPIPLASRDNIIVMEFIGEKTEAAPRLKELRPTRKEFESYLAQTIDFMAKLYKAGLVHADLSEYNILVKRKTLFFIDFAQAVLLNHPKAKEFFQRDVLNMANYFSKNGLETSYEEMYAAVKKRNEEL